MEDDRNVLINLGADEDNDTKNDNGEPIEINQMPESFTVLNLTQEDVEGATESSTDPVAGDSTQQNAYPTDTATESAQNAAQTPPPDYSALQGIDAYNPRLPAATLSDRPPIPQGIPPPPYQGFSLGTASAAEMQSFSDEAPPEYPGPPRGFNPPDSTSPTINQYPPGSRLAQALEMERRREIGRLIVLSAVMNACEERSRRGPQAGSAAQPGIRRPRQCSDAVTRARRARMYGAALGLGVMVVVFIIIGLAVRHRSSSDSYLTDHYNNMYDHNRKTTTAKPKATCFTYRCHNGGRCDDFRYSEPRCLCPSAYYGTHCQYRHYDMYDHGRSTTHRPIITTKSHFGCYAGRCENGGTCHVWSYIPECLCRSDYYGSRCQFRRFNTDLFRTTTPGPIITTKSHFDCYADRCENGGTCYTGNFVSECLCRSDYYGSRCQFRRFNMDMFRTTTHEPYGLSLACLLTNCYNGGSCREIAGRALCLCPHNYYGTQCQYKTIQPDVSSEHTTLTTPTST